MPLSFNNAPYYNDYDASKQFYDILFRPGYAVQARELTQLQSILEEQVRRFGQHIFQEGSMVIPGQITLDQGLQYVKINPTFSSLPVAYDLVDPQVVGSPVQIQGHTSGVVATVVQVNRTANALYVKYTSAGTDNTTQTFADNEQLNVLPANSGFAQSISSNSTGVTAAASIQDGVYFIFGRFLKIFSQTIRVADFNPNPSARIGAQVVETIVTPEDDQSLTDNAAGSPNFAAPGAHRYKLDLVLVAKDLTDTDDENFVELLRVQDGVVQKIVDKTLYSEIEKTLARRTDDANGSFTVRPFKLDIREHLLDGNNKGVFTAPQGGDATKLAIGVEPGKAYVFGHEIETIIKQQIPTAKARTTAFFQNSRTRAYLGNYIHINRLFALPSYDTWPQVNLYDVHITTDGVAPIVSPIGTATIRGIEFSQGSFANIGQPGPIWRAYITDIHITGVGKTLEDVRALAVSDGTLTTTANVLSQVDIVNVAGSFTAGSTITSGALTETVYAWDTTNNMLLTLPTTTAIPNNSAITSSSTGSANILARTVLFDTEDNILTYPLPQSVVATVRDRVGAITTSYAYRKVFGAVAESAGKVTFTTGTNEVFASVALEDYVATIETGTNAGKLIDVTASSPTLQSSLTQLSFNAPSGTTVKLSATVIKQVAAERTKTLQTQDLAVASPSTVINLGRADVYSPVGIWEGTDDTGTPINDRYIFDTGQRDNLYDFGTLTLKSGAVNPANVFIRFQYFTHGGGDYFSVDSYQNFGSYTNWYERIPYYTAKSGQLIYLRDCLDFRPRVDDSTWPPASSVPAVPTYATGGVGKLVKPNDDIETDFSYYLARYDKLYLDGNGNFKVLQGTPSLNPVPPADPADGMVIASMRLGAYTFGPKDTNVQMVDNRRYTMRDIGKIDRRVGQLEYYTALNLLEKETAAFQVPDATTGLDRFKSGFVVDPFNDQRVADASNPDVRYAIDGTAKQMRPTYNSDSVDMLYDATQSSNVEYRTLKTGNDVLTLPYTEVPLITQDKASRSENLNPYNVFNFTGTLTLNPATDTWKDTNYRPDVVTQDNSVYDAVSQTLNASHALGTVWNEWSTDWVGVQAAKVVSESSVYSAPHSVPQPGNVATANGEWAGFQGVLRQTLTTTQHVVQTTQTGQSRQGISTSLGSVQKDTVDDKIVSVALIPYIRARAVTFTAKCLKPNTRYYAFFDDVDVNVNCSPTTLVSDANGALTGTFNIPDPNAGGAAFRVGARVFRLCDDPQNRKDVIQSFADATYNASGLLETHQKTITSVREPVLVKNTVTDTRVVTSTQETDVVKAVQWVDPLAQSFLVGTLQGGYCATSIDLFFRTKDAGIPVTLQIREMQNGTPTQKVVPFSTVVLNPSQINISEDATAKTNFAFESPVYLQQSVEYAIVLLSNSNNYQVWCATLGDRLLNSDRFISQVPYTGVLFKSQNASTWTPAQTEALKFTLYRAQYNTGVVGKAYFKNDVLGTKTLPTLRLITYNGTNVVRVLHENHGMPKGSKVTLTIAPGASAGGGTFVNWIASYNGIPVTQIVPTQNADLRSSSQPSGVADTVLGSRTYTIDNVELDSYTISITDGVNAAVNASSSGYTGAAVTLTQNRAYDVLMPMAQELNFAGTQTLWYVRAVTGTSIHGSQVPYQRDVSGAFPFTQMVPNENYYLDAPRVVASQINEDRLINLGTAFDNKSLVWYVELTSQVDNLSPMIDTQRCNAVVINNRIDYRVDGTTPATTPPGAAPVYVAETAATGATAAQARYITRPAQLQNPANSLHVLISVMRPAESQVDVYYKILPTETNGLFADQPYVLMTTDANTDFSAAQNSGDFKDYYWTADGIGNFTTFAIKVVMRSTNSSRVPLCKDLRAIALET